MNKIISTPMFNIDKSFNKILEELKSQNFNEQDFNKLSVGVTDVSKECVDWKFRNRSMILIFQSFPTKKNAEDIYYKLLDKGLKDLDYDPLIYNELSSCRNVFIVK